MDQRILWGEICKFQNPKLEFAAHHLCNIYTILFFFLTQVCFIFRTFSIVECMNWHRAGTALFMQAASQPLSLNELTVMYNTPLSTVFGASYTY